MRVRQSPEEEATAVRPTALPPIHWGPAIVLASALTCVLLLTSGRYGYDGDELYFIAAGRNLSWGYADQPPLIPFLAVVLDSAFPGSLTALRAPVALLTGGGALLTAMITRELGGHRQAQMLATTAYAASPFILWSGHLLATVSVDAFLWTLVSYLVLRWMRTRRDRLLLVAGLCTALALQVKYLIPALWLTLAVGAVLAGQRDLLRRPLLWAGGAIAVLSVLPSLGWQVANGWPHLQFSVAVAEEQEVFQDGRWGFPAWFAFYAGPIGIVLVGCGLYRLMRPGQHRILGWTVVTMLALVLALNGRPYYLIGLFPLVFGAGATHLETRATARWRRRWTQAACGVSTILAAVLLLPVLPLDVAQRHPQLVPNPLLRSETGWPGLADDVAAVHRSLPPGQRANTVVIADVYPHAAALEFYGPSRGLPDVYSGHRGYWYFGAPPDEARSAIVVGGSGAFLRQRFSHVRMVGRVGSDTPLENVVLRTPVIWKCSGLKEPWSRSWPQWRHMNVEVNQ